METDAVLIENHIVDFYHGLFGVPGEQYVQMNANFWVGTKRISQTAISSLVAPFTAAEIKLAVFSSASDGAPGPDGIPFSFYQKYWDIIQFDLIELFNQFYLCNCTIDKLNRAMICLIPKVPCAEDIKQYRPISLLNCSYKIITKVLTNRLEPVINELLDQSQGAFLKNRFILDNVVCVSEIIHHAKITNSEGVVLKIDLEKAYDRVHWNFLYALLKGRGFPAKFINWIKLLFSKGFMCVNINGSLSKYFEVHRGLKQGDPLSPVLFNLVADTLNVLFLKARNAGLVKGLGPILEHGHQVTNLHYADDTIIFCKADAQMIQTVKWVFVGFEALSGLKVNYSKCDLYPINIQPVTAQKLAECFGCKMSTWPLKYLGIPVHWQKTKLKDWQTIVDRFQQKLQSWKGNFLSLGGKITLINSVLSALPLYQMSVHVMPSKIRKQLDSIRNNFLWNSGDRKRYHLCKWMDVCRPKDQGGLGILDLKFMNISLLCKWLWRLKDPFISGWWKSILQIKYQNSTNRKKVVSFLEIPSVF